MRRLIASAAVTAVGATVLAVAGNTAPAAAAQGKVVVFSLEVAHLSIYDNPTGCKKLPLEAHVLDNLTDRPVTIYADPWCATPGLTVQPGDGSHVVPGSGSFSA